MRDRSRRRLLERGYWRIAASSLDIRKCDNEACPGGKAASCIDGHAGPECQVCTKDLHYVNPDSGLCAECPSPVIPVFALVAVAVGVVLLLLLLRVLRSRLPGVYMSKLTSWAMLASGLAPFWLPKVRVSCA